jgi:glycerophosphoryl diester phosphodiesterase
VSGAAPAHPFFAGDTPRVLAHRGLVTEAARSDGVVENSFAAVAAAQAVGADIIESDCHLTRDGVVVLLHDRDLLRVTGDPREVTDVTAAELADLMDDRGGMITLAEALEAFPEVRFNLDAKAAGVAVRMGREIAPHADRVLVASFSDDNRRRALEAAVASGGNRPATSAGQATVARALLAVAARSERLIARALAGIDALQIPERYGRLRLVTPRLVDAAHRHGVEVHVWTVNDPDEMRRLVGIGADGIVTDHADVALRALR